jgi:hypothetical protein
MTRSMCMIFVVALITVTSSSAARAVVYLNANFDNKTVDDPIGTGGPDVGEPIEYDPFIGAVVRGIPMPTPCLQLTDESGTSAGAVRFEFVDGTEITSGSVGITVNLWFEEYENYFLYVREQGTSMDIFTNLNFSQTGEIFCNDENGDVGVIGTYQTGEHLRVRLAYNMDVGIYSIWLNETLVLGGEDHGVVGRGVGAVLLGCTYDGDLDGVMNVDDLFVADYPGSQYYLNANFNYKTLNMPIETGGPEVGEPIAVDPFILAYVRPGPLYTPSLEITDNDDYAAGYATFEFVRGEEVVNGLVVIAMDLWFDKYDRYNFIVREHGSAAYRFSDLHFGPDGMIQCSDAGGVVGSFGPYQIGRVHRIMIVHNLDAGTYDVWMDGLLKIDDEPHGIMQRGIGRVALGCANDSDYDGRIYLDNLWVSTSSPPGRRVCCMSSDCGVMIAMDCAFNAGEYHPEWSSCEPNPCTPSAIGPQGMPATRGVTLAALPNPFPGATTLHYALPEPTRMRVEVFDAGGRLVRLLHDGTAVSGDGEIVWDGRSQVGLRVPSGMYFGRLTTENGTAVERLIVLE